MDKISSTLYSDFTNEELLDFTIEQIDNLKKISMGEDEEKYERNILVVDRLIIEVKRRKISIGEPMLMKRIFNI